MMDSNPDTTPRKGLLGSLLRRGSLIRKRPKVSQVSALPLHGFETNLKSSISDLSILFELFRPCRGTQDEQVMGTHLLPEEIAGDRTQPRRLGLGLGLEPLEPEIQAQRSLNPRPRYAHVVKTPNFSRSHRLILNGRRSRRCPSRGRAGGSSASMLMATGRLLHQR
jgi:hypothetical protein